MRAIHKKINPDYKREVENLLYDYRHTGMCYLYTEEEYIDRFIPKDIKMYSETEGDLVNVDYAEFTGVLLDNKGNYHKYPLSEFTVVTDTGNISDGYHTFNELYEFRLLYNAAFFNLIYRGDYTEVYKSKLHSDGEHPFGDPNWFIVVAKLPAVGQISNHYEMKDWDLFKIPEKYQAEEWDGHTSQDVAKRLRTCLKKMPNAGKICSTVRCQQEAYDAFNRDQ